MENEWAPHAVRFQSDKRVCMEVSDQVSKDFLTTTTYCSSAGVCNVCKEIRDVG